MPPLVSSTDNSLSNNFMPLKLDAKCPHHNPPTIVSPSAKFSMIRSLQQKASRVFLLRQYGPAWSTCLDALDKLHYELEVWSTSTPQESSLPTELLELRPKLWVLYINIFGNKERQEQQNRSKNGLLKQQTSGKQEGLDVTTIWNKIVDSYSGVESEVDVEVTIACILLYLNRNLESQARDIIERWFCALPDALICNLETLRLEIESTHSGDNILKDTEISRLWPSYEKIVELYVLHVLPKLSEWETARDFLVYNTVISISRKETYQQRLEKLYQRSLKPRKRSSINGLSNCSKMAIGHASNYSDKVAGTIIKTVPTQQASVTQSKDTSTLETDPSVEVNPNDTSATPTPTPASSSIPPKGTISNQNAKKWVQRWFQQLTRGGARSGVLIVIILVLIGMMARNKWISRTVRALRRKLW
ncbi:hypothetical protein K7432_009227 [Basidiobolus ranarum]|uniref:Uncharacterized protein n=1 Tax=Basidiobolus ranarum TaxID=34480 RepID=A0ABR2WQK1_9FUNG